jgi:chemotaxis-related protein WspB
MLFLLFELGRDRYLLDARHVVEILPMVRIKQIPQAPRGVAGLVNYRGATVPVVDLSAIALDRPAARTLGTRLVLVRYPDDSGTARLLGLIAERATDVVRRAETDFVEPPARADAAPYLGRVATDQAGVLQRVEIRALLSPAVQAALFTRLDED